VGRKYLGEVQNLTVQKVYIGLVTGVFLLISPWLTSEFLGGNPMPVITLVALGVLLVFLFALKDKCWLIIPFCLPIEGTFNFLPLNFSMFELAVLYVFSYMVLQIIMGQQIFWKLGPPFFWIPLSGLLVILLYHWIRSGDIGIRALGGTGWGGRYYFRVMIAALTIPILSSFSGSSWRDFQKVPLFYFLGSFVDIVPQVISTLVPATAPVIFRFYSSVNIVEYGKQLSGAFGEEQGITRIGQLGRLGTGLSLVILSYFPFSTWLNPSRFWIIPGLFFSFFCSAIAGFRSYIFNWFLISMVGLYATARSRVFLVFPVTLLGLGLMVLSQGSLVNYPRSLQRAFSFLPGNWDPVAVKETDGSSTWRKLIRELFWAEYFKKAPLLGQGYHFNPQYAQEEQDIYLRRAFMDSSDPYKAVRGFIERRNPHEGDIHVILVAGSIGASFFILICLGSFLYALVKIYRTPVRQVSPLQVWCSALIVQQSVSFFVVFGDLALTLNYLCPIVTLLYVGFNVQQAVAPKAAPFKSIVGSTDLKIAVPQVR